MRAFLRNLVVTVLVVVGCGRLSAFSLLGSYAIDLGGAVWQVPQIGYGLNADLGGSMNLGEEYRFNVPYLSYGFDESFLNYFGSRGVEEIEKAISIFNALPKFSELSAGLEEFPMDTRRFNYQATALNLYDLKSVTMSFLMEQLGAAGAERWVWALRNYVPPADPVPPIYTVIKRNFDPVTFEPSSYVNGSLYTYQILAVTPTPDFDAVEFETDPTLPSVTSVSATWNDLALIGASGSFLSGTTGMFFTGLTRDDIGALRYIYRPSNLNIENVATNAVATVAGAGTGVVGTGGSNPFLPPPGGTNTAGVTTNSFVNAGLRAGIDKVTFVRVNPESLVGVWLPITNVWKDTYVTNGAPKTQTLQRVDARPDILFSASDLGIVADGELFYYIRSLAMQNNDAINGASTFQLSGPGTLGGQTEIGFSKVGPWFLLTGGGEDNHTALPVWGSYDGSTNIPVVYPSGTSIKTLEQIIMSGAANNRLNPYLAPAALLQPVQADAQVVNDTGGTAP